MVCQAVVMPDKSRPRVLYMSTASFFAVPPPSAGCVSLFKISNHSGGGVPEPALIRKLMPVYAARLTGVFAAAVAPGAKVAPKPTYMGCPVAVECTAYLLHMAGGGVSVAGNNVAAIGPVEAAGVC